MSHGQRKSAQKVSESASKNQQHLSSAPSARDATRSPRASSAEFRPSQATPATNKSRYFKSLTLLSSSTEVFSSNYHFSASQSLRAPHQGLGAHAENRPTRKFLATVELSPAAQQNRHRFPLENFSVPILYKQSEIFRSQRGDTKYRGEIPIQIGDAAPEK